ncbi:FecR domain-containing protein [Steroidobacter sp. S1-65]|uniref:FecR domain-containing protein n=1 Tax=Steroidobacter gossypii TaxID=2805490 RepID=A0ABS1X6E8_9GAMM|nr:FecR domain-containing protein [Steroidobacter gossypii]MBM0108784.1 FecR domain-containing protein [Steroidobacter gossypii]
MEFDHDIARDPATTHARQCAAHWLAVLSDEKCTEAERRQFFVWLRASGQHVQEFLRLSRLNGQLNNRQLWPDRSVAELVAAARASSEGNIATLDRPLAVDRTSRKTVRWPLAAVVACAFVATGLIAGRSQIEGWLTPEYVTAVGEQRSITLEDGSVVELNSRSRLRAHLEDDLRAIELLEGEAIFRVAKDPDRPFRVRTGVTDIVAVGTAFNVKASDSRTVVTVLEGRVRVNQRAAAERSAAQAAKAVSEFELAMGDQLILAKAQPAIRVSLRDTEKVTSWTERRLIFEDTPLSSAAAEFARYSSRTIRIEDPSVGARKITGVFDATDPASLAEFLSGDETLHVRSDSEGWSVSSR